MKLKICTKCGYEKLISEFYKPGRGRTDYLNSWCRTCNNEYRRNYYNSPKMRRKINEAQKERRKKKTKEKQAQIRHCALCGKEFTGHHNKRYCSEKCQQKMKREKAKKIKLKNNILTKF